MLQTKSLETVHAVPSWLSNPPIDRSLVGSEYSLSLAYSAASLLKGIGEAGLRIPASGQWFEFGSGWGEGLLALDRFTGSQGQD